MKADIEKLFLDSLINSLPDNIYFKDRESRFLMINRALAERFGLKDPSEALGRTDADFFDEQHAREAREDELQVMATGKPLIGREERETTLHGDTRWVLSTKLPLFDTEGQMIGTFGVSRDVTAIKKAQQSLLASQEELRRHQDTLEETVRQRTAELSIANQQMAKEVQERKLIEQSLRLSEERYRRLLQVNPTYIYTVTIDRKSPVRTEHSPSCINVTGYSPEEYLENPNLWIIMVHPDERELVKKFVTEDLTQRNHQNQIEHRIIHKDGRVRWVRNTVVHHYDAEGELVRYDGLVEDITARKNADERQRENDRLRTIVDLADAVASSYSDLIKRISTHNASLSQRVLKDTVLNEHAKSITDAVEQAERLNNRLLSAAKAYSHDPGKQDFLQTVDIHKIANKAVKTARRSLRRKDVEIKTFFPPEVPLVNANPDQLLDTLNNMLINASEAMPEGGTITITASSKNILRSSHRWNQIARGGKYVILRVSDTGVGMDKDQQKKIFDTFFSARKEDGLGLGLAIAQAAVRSWGGWIRVGSHPGKGSTFRIFMPAIAEQAKTADAPRPAVTLKGRTVLLVDDDSAFASQIEDALHGEGATVLKAHTDTEAVDILAANPERISVCIVDMILRSHDWQKTLSEIYELTPKAHVIVMSGFSREYARANLPVGAWSFLQKPFEPETLLQLAKDIIGRDTA